MAVNDVFWNFVFLRVKNLIHAPKNAVFEFSEIDEKRPKMIPLGGLHVRAVPRVLTKNHKNI